MVSTNEDRKRLAFHQGFIVGFFKLPYNNVYKEECYAKTGCPESYTTGYSKGCLAKTLKGKNWEQYQSMEGSLNCLTSALYSILELEEKTSG